MDLLHKELFTLLKIACFASLLVFQWKATLVMLRRFGKKQTSDGSRQGYRTTALVLTGVILLSANAGGGVLVFLGSTPFPAWLMYVSVYLYLGWLFVCAGALITALANRAHKKTAKLLRERRKTDVEPAPVAPTEEAQADTGRRRFLKAGLYGTPILVFGGAASGAKNDDEFEIVRQNIRIPNLPEKLKGLKIGMLADIHSGPYMSKEEIDEYVTATNALNPDLILLPGDFVTNKNEEMEPLCDSIRHLKAEYGVYGCLGNHDFFADENYVTRELENAGVVMLRDAHTFIHPRGEKYALIGLDDIMQRHPFDDRMAKAVKGLDKSLPHILMCHKPYYIEEASQWGVNFMVSGHTHGGQIVLGRIGKTVISLHSLISEYVAGHYSMDATQLYVTRGVGTSLIPIRWNCPPEITLFTLV